MKANAKRTREAPRRVDPASWVDAHAGFLYRYALHRAHDATAAEDLVQETLLAALEAAPSYEGRSLERTWLTSILRHKIADHFRARRLQQDPGVQRLEEWSDDLFDRRGKWKRTHSDWPPFPTGGEERAELAAKLEECLGRLPSQVAEMFVLYEQRDVPAKRLAAAVGITTGTLWVRLYRARLALRECLHQKWVGEQSQ